MCNCSVTCSLWAELQHVSWGCLQPNGPGACMLHQQWVLADELYGMNTDEHILSLYFTKTNQLQCGSIVNWSIFFEDIHNKHPWYQDSWGHHGAHLGPIGPRGAPCWPHELCYLGPQTLTVRWRLLLIQRLNHVLQYKLTFLKSCKCVIDQYKVSLITQNIDWATCQIKSYFYVNFSHKYWFEFISKQTPK